MDADDIMRRWYNEKRMNSIEGDSGLQKMEELFEACGYGHGMRHGSPLEHFLSDNPGACQAIMDWFEEQLEQTPDWQEGMLEELGEETWGIEVEWFEGRVKGDVYKDDPFGAKYAEEKGLEVMILQEAGPLLRFSGPSSLIQQLAGELDPGDNNLKEQLKDPDEDDEEAPPSVTT